MYNVQGGNNKYTSKNNVMNATRCFSRKTSRLWEADSSCELDRIARQNSTSVPASTPSWSHQPLVSFHDSHQQQDPASFELLSCHSQVEMHKTSFWMCWDSNCFLEHKGLSTRFPHHRSSNILYNTSCALRAVSTHTKWTYRYHWIEANFSKEASNFSFGCAFERGGSGLSSIGAGVDWGSRSDME